MSWYDAVPMLDIIGRIVRLSIVPVGVSLCFLAVPQNFSGDEPVGYMFSYSFGGSLIFLTALCIFIFIFFVDTFCNLQNCLMLSMFIHFSVKYPLSMITIPLPLSWSSSNIRGFLDNLFVTSLSLYDILIVL